MLNLARLFQGMRLLCSSASHATRAARESNPQSFFIYLFFPSYQLWGRFQVTSRTDGNLPHSKGAISKRLSPQIMTRWVAGLGRPLTQGDVF